MRKVESKVRRTLPALAAGAALLVAGSVSHAVDYEQEATKLIVKANPGAGTEKLVWVSKLPAPILPSADPIVVGAGFQILNPISGENANFALPAGAANWKTNAAGTLFKFVNKLAPAAPSEVKVALIKEGKVIKVVAKDNGISLDEPTQGTLGVILEVGPDRYCSECSSPSKDEPNKFIAKDCPAPSVCPVLPGPAVCGDMNVQAGEQCDDGNTDPGDGCNALCEVEGNTCAGIDGVRTVRVDISTPEPLAGIRVDLEYPQIQTGIPGSGNSSIVQSRVTLFPVGGLTALNDHDSDLSVFFSSASENINSGPLFEVDFDECWPITENICNRNQNVIGCCNNMADPTQFGNFCRNSLPAPGMACNADADCPAQTNSICTADNVPYACCDGVGIGTCTGTVVDCVFKCPFNPPRCNAGNFPIFPNVGPCTTPNGGCPADNVCFTQLQSTGCSVSEPVDDQGTPVEGVTCTVTIL